MPPSLPTREEINIHDDLDGRVACENFFGKSLEEAEVLFREKPLYYGSDLLWMGPVAFRFYVPAAIRFIASEHSAWQADFINGFYGTLNRRLEYERNELAPIAKQLAAVCDYIVRRWPKFQANEKIYGRRQRRYVELQQRLKQLAQETDDSTQPPL